MKSSYVYVTIDKISYVRDTAVKPIQRKFVDRKKTGKNLQLLREHNLELRRFVCGALKHDKSDCSGQCKSCKFEMDNHISRSELAEMFGVSESVIFNWESGRTMVSYEDLLLYAQLTGLKMSEIVILME